MTKSCLVQQFNVYMNLRNWQYGIAASRKEMCDLFVSNKFMNLFFSYSRFPYTSMLAIYIFWWVAQDYAFRILFICSVIVEWNTKWNRKKTDITISEFQKCWNLENLPERHIIASTKQITTSVSRIMLCKAKMIYVHASESLLELCISHECWLVCCVRAAVYGTRA